MAHTEVCTQHRQNPTVPFISDHFQAQELRLTQKSARHSDKNPQCVSFRIIFRHRNCPSGCGPHGSLHATQTKTQSAFHFGSFSGTGIVLKAVALLEVCTQHRQKHMVFSSMIIFRHRHCHNGTTPPPPPPQGRVNCPTYSNGCGRDCLSKSKSKGKGVVQA